MIINIIYKEFTEMTIIEQTFSQKNAESNILLHKSNIITRKLLLEK